MKKIILFIVAIATTYSFAQQTSVTDSISLDEVVVVGGGVIDLAKDRVTPVASNTLTAEDFEDIGAGNVEFGETLKMVPNVYFASNNGYGDAELFVRGFDMVNTALMINGQPVNAVEDGKVYWSNWSGMSDVAQAVEVQRGLGSSKLAISSVGGTINIVTKTTESTKGGYFRTLAGSGGYAKASFAYNTGINDKGWAFSMLLDQWRADKKPGRKFTAGQGQVYFFSVGYRPNSKNNFNLMFTGAPQWHHNAWSEGSSHFEQYGLESNDNGGMYKGREHSERRNFYHKPVANFTWDWNINDKLDLSSVLYGSWGRGGGTGDVGRGRVRIETPGGREIDFDAIEANNIANADANGYVNFGNGYMRRSSMNLHDWYGVISNLNFDNGGDFTYNVGIDGRTYTGTHFRQMANMYGASGYTDNYRWGSRPSGFTVTETYPADPWSTFFGNYAPEDQRYAYDYEETINYIGGFGQVEYTIDRWSTFLQGSLSTQSMQRTGRSDGFDGSALGTNDKQTFDGYNIKGGFSFKLSDKSIFYANTGFYSKQPFFANLFTDDRYSGEWINLEDANEEITGYEIGYSYTSENIRLIVDAYSTEWGNRAFRINTENEAGDQLRYNLTGVGQLHKGVEFQADLRYLEGTDIKLFATLGNWLYQGNADYNLTTESASTGSITTSSGSLSVQEVKVGRAPQTSFGISLKNDLTDDLSVDLRYNYYADQYAYVDPDDVIAASIDGSTYQSEKLEDYGLMDMGLTYKFSAGSNDMKFRFNVYNFFDTTYITTIQQYGILYGIPRTFNMSLKYMF